MARGGPRGYPIIVVSLPLFGCRGRSSTQPRAVCFSLTLSLAKLGPETGTRIGPTAAVPVPFLLRGDGNGPSPQPSPKMCQRHLARPHEVRRPAIRCRPTLSSHQVERSRQAAPRHGRPQDRDRDPRGRTEQGPVVGDPAPNQERAPITHARESAADVSAWEPDALAADPAEQGRCRRADDRDVPEPHEIIAIVRRGHGTILLPESAPSTRGEGAVPLAQDRAAG